MFQFPSNGKAYLNGLMSFLLLPYRHWFQFPSNGKAYLNGPQFAPSLAVAPERQNQTRAAQGFFCFKIYPKNPANPRVH